MLRRNDASFRMVFFFALCKITIATNHICTSSTSFATLERSRATHEHMHPGNLSNPKVMEMFGWKMVFLFQKGLIFEAPKNRAFSGGCM